MTSNGVTGQTSSAAQMIDAKDSGVRIVILGLWFGLMAGYLEFATVQTVQSILQQVHNRDVMGFVFMPLVNGLLFAALAVIIVIVSRLLRRPFPRPWAIFIFAALSFYGLSRITDRIHWVAWSILAMGLAAVLTRSFAAHSQRWDHLVKVTLTFGLALLTLSTIGAAVVPGWRERRLDAALPPAKDEMPNVLIVVMDTVSAKRMSVYGYERPTTPNLEAFARGGVVFDQSYATTPWTLPSHISIMTGRQSYEQTATYVRPMDRRHLTLAEHLRKQGYRTSGFVANWFYCTPEFGLSKGLTHYNHPRSTLARLCLASSWSTKLTKSIYKHVVGSDNEFGRKRASTVTDQFVDWLDRRPDGPFFSFLNYMDTHTPYVTPRAFENHFGTVMTDDPMLAKYWYQPDYQYTADERQQIIDTVDSCLAYVDDQLGKLFDHLEERGLDQNTLVIITGDHGEMLGEHGLYEHSNSLYSELVRVPLILRWPGVVPEAERVDTPVSIADIPATILDLLGDNEAPLPGTSIAPAWRGDAIPGQRPIYFELGTNHFAKLREIPVSKGPLRGMIIDQMYYIDNPVGEDELYDWVNDADQANDLSSTELGKQTIREAEQILQPMGD